jgi:glycosyltransferase involved in cell wall biosynthesis
LQAGGYLGGRDQEYFREVQAAARDLGSAFEYVGSPDDRRAKVAFLNSLDVLSVPTVYHEPKGLYLLEALANGVPVVQPDHGAFPELIEATGGGVLVPPGDPAALAAALEDLLLKPERRLLLAESGYAQVRSRYGAAGMARATLEIFANGAAVRPPQPIETAGERV